MSAELIFEWTFSPPGYFEDRAEFDAVRGRIFIEDGRVEVRVSADPSYDLRAIRNEMQQEVNARFLAAQVLSHQPYSLIGPTVRQVRQDGVTHYILSVDSGTIKLTCESADLKVTDAAGNVIRDTRQERIDRRMELARKAAAHITDPTVNSVLRSYSAAVNDPSNELIHLYEIRDAMSAHFGGEIAARAALGVSSSEWSRLGHLANDEPIAQGRHRGKQLGALRAATPEELEEARLLARKMIDRFLISLP